VELQLLMLYLVILICAVQTTGGGNELSHGGPQIDQKEREVLIAYPTLAHAQLPYTCNIVTQQCQPVICL